MCVGALVCFALGVLVSPSSSLASVYYRGSYLFAAGDVVLLASPVVLWIRGHGWR